MINPMSVNALHEFQGQTGNRLSNEVGGNIKNEDLHTRQSDLIDDVNERQVATMPSSSSPKITN